MIIMIEWFIFKKFSKFPKIWQKSLFKMSKVDLLNADQLNNFNEYADDENYENDDLFAFQLSSKTINLYYTQITKYSKLIRDNYTFKDVISRFPQEIRDFQKELHLSFESVILFFQILEQNSNIKENALLQYNQCVDLLKISKYLEIRKLSKQINDYIKSHTVDVDFIIQMIQYEIQLQKETKKTEYEINSEIENILTNKISECFTNEKFAKLPISTIYRIIEKSSYKGISSDELFDFIKKSVSEFYVFFQFIEIGKLSENRLSELLDLYSKMDKTSQHYFNYLPFNFLLFKEMFNKKTDLQERVKSLESINDSQQGKMKEFEAQMNQIKKQFKDTEQQQRNEFEAAIKNLQDQLNDSKQANELLQKQLNSSEKEKDEFKKKLADSEKAKNDLQEKLNEEIMSFKGEISASVKSGLIVSARIKLTSKGRMIDTSKSKYIISTSNAEFIGEKSYEKGEPITSLEMNTTDFICRPGTYFVRCIVFSTDGKSVEFVSNEVRTSGTSVLLGYEGKKAEFHLFQGKYKLEVWGAQGGDSVGERDKSYNTSNGKGGLGGYSRGTIQLNRSEKIFVFVGGEGKPANSSDGATTDGSFPDGGGTKTGHRKSATCVPGTGGGSTSIRIARSTDYHRVIVAGGGGGASGDSMKTTSGGFGGGTSGGNCYFRGELINQGSGTQTGSTCGKGDRNFGDPGEFGKGATGKYRQGRDSGGGGGGGWYGGGSGGYGGNWDCSSGGGGSGWIFTESSLMHWQSGDSSNASKFLLDSSYYLTDAQTLEGDKEFPRPDGNGTERGHPGDGYAKITPV